MRTRHASGEKKKPKAPSALERVAAIFERYTIAGVAGPAVLVGVLGLILWAGGYFAMMGAAVHRAAGVAGVAAGLEVRRVLLRGAHQTAHEEVLDALGPLIGGPIIQVSSPKPRPALKFWLGAFGGGDAAFPNTISVANSCS